MDPINLKSEFEDLILDLEAKDKFLLSADRKAAMKERLLARVKITPHKRAAYSIFSLAAAVRGLSEKLNLSVVQKVEIKERVMVVVAETSQRKFFISDYFALVRKTVSAALLVFLSFGIFSFMTASREVVIAGTFTMLDSFSGKVSIKRGGELIDLKIGIPLMENDELITGSDGVAVVRYFDNSISRLDHDTDLRIDKLLKLPDNPIDTHVEVSLIAGKVWARVLNLVESDASFVVRARDISAEAKKAAFTVDLRDEKVEVGVFNHAVEIKSNGKTEQVLTGEKMVVNNGSQNIKQLDDNEKTAVWVKDNMKNDQVYLSQVEQRLLEAKKKIVGASGKLDVSLLLSFDNVNKEKLKLDIAERDFMGAQIKLSGKDVSDADKLQAQAVMQAFGDEVKSFYSLVEEVSRTDQAYAKELRDYVDAKVLLQKKDLALAVPDSPSYEAKKILDDAQLVGVQNEADKMILRVDQVTDKLAVAEDVKASGNNELATKVVDEYKQDMQGVMTMVDNLPKSQSELKDQVAEKVADNIDLLKAMDVVPDQKVEEVKQIAEPLIVKVEGSVTVESPLVPVEKVEEIKPEIIEPIDPTKVVDGPYGVQIQGEKPLSPLLQDIK